MRAITVQDRRFIPLFFRLLDHDWIRNSYKQEECRYGKRENGLMLLHGLWQHDKPLCTNLA